MFSNWKSVSHSNWRPMVNGQVIPFPPTKPHEKLVEEGFPLKVSRAFQKTADELNCVIWSRVPGKACTTLIDEGYNLKPFYVHGKSCNWGPMAGFVCQLPALNKGGASKMDYNLKEHKNSLKWLAEIKKREKNEPDKVAGSLFLPLVISDARKQELIDKDFLPNHKAIGNDVIVGIAQDSNETVAVEYLMKKQAAPSNLWNIYHRNIYIKQKDRYVNYLTKNRDSFSIDQDDAADYEASIRDSIRSEALPNQTQINAELAQLLGTLNLNPLINNGLTQFYAVNGIQSPYLAYRDEANRYKNAVSGDYDLFAVWPFTPNASFEMTTRISERASKPSDPKKIQNLFIPVEAKENALEITKSRNVFIEFIGTYAELDGKENPELGNISDLVSITAQTLNSLVRSIYLGKKEPEDKGQFPNRAFHSDEGGRPGVDEIEYPIAFFMPKSQWDGLKQHDLAAKNVLKNTAFVVETHTEFLSLVELLKRRFYVFLHDGWFMHWMCLAAGKEKIENVLNNELLASSNVLSRKSRKYFEARSQEIDRLGDSLQDIDAQLKKLLTSRPAAATNDAFLDVTDSFIEIALLPGSSVEERKTTVLDLSADQTT